MEPKNPFNGLILEKTNSNDFVSQRSNFLRLVGATNESLRLILTCYMFKYSFEIKQNFARVTSERQKSFKVGLKSVKCGSVLGEKINRTKLFGLLKM